MHTYVLIHGGGHGGWCYDKVTARLPALGHRVFAPSLSGMAEHTHQLSPSIDLDTHITDVVNLLFFEDLRDVVLVGHSYGGMVITGVVDRAADRVGKVVYLDAANPVNGQSLVDVAGSIILITREVGETRDGVELVLLPGEGAGAFYGVEDPDDLAWVDARLTPHPWACFEQKLELTDEAATASIPRFHIVCESTLATRDPQLLGTARAEGRLWSIDTGHDLMITEPDFVTSTLVEIGDR
ncbi:MAG: alpha/beta fold hydrolase [Ilumatobacteraceae bacterium]